MRVHGFCPHMHCTLHKHKKGRASSRHAKLPPASSGSLVGHARRRRLAVHACSRGGRIGPRAACRAIFVSRPVPSPHACAPDQIGDQPPSRRFVFSRTPNRQRPAWSGVLLVRAVASYHQQQESLANARAAGQIERW